MPTKVKICGVTEPEGALAAVELGADYLGLNFFSASPRYLDRARALAIADAVRGRVELVGVFVDAPLGVIERTVEEVGLDLVQLSGHEEPATVRPLATRVLKAFRGGALPGPEDLARFGPPWGVLLDAPHSTLFGGTGDAWDYGRVAARGAEGAPERLFLAGGLGPENVRQAVRLVGPYAVDACSRIERSPGIKDWARMERFFQEVKLGQDSTSA